MQNLLTIIKVLAAGLSVFFYQSIFAAEVDSPEQFMKSRYGWTIRGLDAEKGVFGKYKRFACFDDRVTPPRAEEEFATKRFGSDCNSKRARNENLSAMIFIVWSNPKHEKPHQIKDEVDRTAKAMAGAQADQGIDAKCSDVEKISLNQTSFEVLDCSIALPFGTFFASFAAFELRGLRYIFRVQNASSVPSADEPKRVVRDLVKAVTID
jgi:hypothetical protein